MSKRILVIDGKPERQQSMVEMLTAAGYEADTAADAASGLALSFETHPDAILTRQSLPDSTGVALLQALQNAEQHMPAILITDEKSEALAIAAFRSGAVDYLRDPVTEQALQAALHRAEQQTARTDAAEVIYGILSHAAEAVIVVDGRNNLLFCNETARRLFQLPDQNTLLNRPLKETISNPDIRKLFEQQPDPDASPRTEITAIDGQITLSARLTHIQNLGRMAIMQDITALKELDHIKSSFVQRVSQDIRSPLTTILGYVELLGRSDSLSKEQSQFIERITFSVRSITALLTDLLELSRIEDGFDTTREPTQLALVARYAIEGIRQACAKKGVHLITDMPEQAPLIIGHPIRLRQMLNNLLDNAITYTPAEGTVTMTLSQQADFLLLSVADTGTGIPADDQPHVFEEFYRGSNSSGPGTGLGLSIVKNIVEQHNGRIWLESQEGQGTTFTVMLPIQNGQ